MIDLVDVPMGPVQFETRHPPHVISSALPIKSRIPQSRLVHHSSIHLAIYVRFNIGGAEICSREDRLIDINVVRS